MFCRNIYILFYSFYPYTDKLMCTPVLNFCNVHHLTKFIVSTASFYPKVLRYPRKAIVAPKRYIFTKKVIYCTAPKK